MTKGPHRDGDDDGAAPHAKRPPNRLAKESSPYLLQHAHNPVDWHPWGDEAFALAKKLDRPVFLSIGYSTCHWCHVMERECFEDEAIAKQMNEGFICIKVDREERPDVDAVYMDAVQAIAGQGGWPMSVFLTPEGRPFYGGTYFPPTDRHGRPGFPTVMTRIVELWKTRRDDVNTSSERLVEAIAARGGPGEAGKLTAEWRTHAIEQYRASYDAVHAGFGPAPKFPRAFSHSYLLGRAAADVPLRSMVLTSLDRMARGGIHDHVGGGFHRYSTDAAWLVPHFEKMLYDQALVGRAYLDAYQATGDAAHAAVARGTMEYVLRDLRDPAGGFHSAEDADSEGEEGKFYVWTNAELRAALGDDDAALVSRVYACTDEGNFVEEASRHRTGANILHLESPLAHHSRTLGIESAALESRLAAARAKLFAVRAKRIRPHLDDKVLTDWNGLMIGTLARAGSVLREERYVREAERAADFVMSALRTKDGRLLHRWRKGDAAVPAFLEDHAFLALGLMDLYEATGDPRRLADAVALCRTILAEFRETDGTFRTSGASGEKLIHAPRDLYDGAIPSGNSAAMLALARAGAFTGDDTFTKASATSLEAWAGTIGNYPMGYVLALEANEWHLSPVREIVIAGDPADAATRALLDVARSRLLPGTVLLVHLPGERGQALEKLASFVKGQDPVAGKPAAYVCTGRTCQAPVTDPDALAKLLDGR